MTQFVRVKVPETGTHVTLPASAAAVRNMPRVHGPALGSDGRPRPPKRSINHQTPPAPPVDTEGAPSPTPTQEQE